MPSKLQLVNRVLSELGRLSVTSLNDSQDAQAVSAKIDELYPEVLQQANWNFAIIYRKDDTPLTSNFSPDYQYSYQLPGDFGKIFKFGSNGGDYPVYAFMDDQLLAQTRPIQYYYISNQAPLSALTPLFSRSLVLYVASKMSLIMTNNIQLTEYLANEAEKAKVNAILENDMSRSILTFPYNDYDRIYYV